MRIYLPLLALAYLAACANPEDPDAGTPDLGFTDAGFTDAGPRPDATPDAGTPDAMPNDATPTDATPTDAGMFTILLTTSSTVVTDDAPILLTATPMGETSTVVDFYEGTTYVGSSSTAAFTFSLEFNAGQNGAHVYHAEASANGGRAISNDVAIEVALPRGNYVDPVAGDNTNAGTRAAPFRTIGHAATVAQSGESIFLLDGTYDASNQGAFFCPGILIPAGVSVRAVNAGAAQLVGNASCAFYFQGAGDLEGIAFRDFQVGANFSAGRSVMSGCTFDQTQTIFFANETSDLRVEAGPGFFTNPGNNAFGVMVGVSEESATVTVVGGTYENVTTFNTGLFLARANSTMTIEGATFRDIARPILRVYDNAHATVRDTLIERSGGGGLGAENAVFLIGGQNTQSPIGNSLVLERTQILDPNGHGISISYYANLATRLLVSLTDSRIQDSFGTAILVQGSNFGVNPALDVDIVLVNSPILGGARGIYSLAAGIEIRGGEVSGMTGYGIQMVATDLPSSLLVRNTVFDGNGDDAIHLEDTTMTVDLGTALDPGGNTMSAIPTGASALAVTTALAIDAIGNTWMANEQGADATGHYPPATTATGPTSGLNHNLATGATLVLEP